MPLSVPMHALAAAPCQVTIRPFRPSDAAGVAHVMRDNPDVQFLGWEEDLFRRIDECNAIVLVAVDQREAVLGAIIGGVMGFRGTVNHLAVARPLRRSGLGRALFEQVKRIFAEKQIRRVFIFVDKNADGAAAFWRSQGFRETKNEMTYEIDVV